MLLLARFVSVLASSLCTLLVLAAPIVLNAADGAPAASPVARPPLELRVMSFNLRFASAQPPNAWPERRPIVKRLITDKSPDVIGTQEGLYAQLREMAADLPGYAWIGLGREGGSRSEFMAVFYRHDRFEPVAFDHFWLSDTPNVIGSITWEHTYHRMVTWVRLRDRTTGREFYFWNTHLDHQIEPAREKAAALIRERLAALDRAVPLLLVGDFNCAAGASRPHEILTRDAALIDTWIVARARENEAFNTFHNYETPLREGIRIDWILARPPVVVDRAKIVIDREGAQYPSDHFPVMADMRFE